MGREVSSHAGRLVSEQGFFVPFLSGWGQPALTLDYVTQSFSSHKQVIAENEQREASF